MIPSIGSNGPAASPVGETLFELFTEVTSVDQLRPIEWTLDEALCGSFRLSIRALSPLAVADTYATQLFGQRATFLTHGAGSLVRRGVVSSVSIGGSREVGYVELMMTVLSRIDMMGLRTESRILSNVSTVDVLSRLCEEWQLGCDLRLKKSYGKRHHITQYRETDLAFLERVARRDGIGFFLEHPDFDPAERDKPGPERIVFYDHAAAYAPIPTGSDPSRGSRLVHDREEFEAHEHHVAGFRLERRLVPEKIRLGDFDFRKPGFSLRAGAQVPAAARSPINSGLGGEQLSVYLHADRADLDQDGGKSEISDDLAAIRLEQAQREATVGNGRSRCGRLRVGSTFSLEETEAPSLSQSYVVTKISHRGKIPEIGGPSGDRIVYSNTFECASASFVVRPPLPAPDLRQVTETATVVGPEGKEIHTDEHGRVLVRFHWDAVSEAENTCWLRVATTWAGTGWGSQFIPRTGMEVLVGFLSGDVDQPIILGSVYNGTHPPPFALPAEAAKAGFRTKSTPGGEGGSELSLDDTKGSERLVVRSERDIAQVAGNDFDLDVGGDELVSVHGASKKTVAKDATSTVGGASVSVVRGNEEHAVGGSRTVAVSGNEDLRVSGNRITRIEGRDLTTYFSDVSTTVRADVVERVQGHKITIVGEHDARRSVAEHVEGSASQFSTGTREIVSEKDIVLRVGQSSIRLTPTGLDIVVDEVRVRSKQTTFRAEELLELVSKKELALVAETADVLAEKRAVVRGQGSSLKLAADARLDGAVVKLNCDPEPPDPAEPEPYEPPEPTSIELLDEAGNPLENKRYVLRFGDGTEATGVLSSVGKTEVFIEDACDIVFPDVDKARKG